MSKNINEAMLGAFKALDKIKTLKEDTEEFGLDVEGANKAIDFLSNSEDKQVIDVVDPNLNDNKEDDSNKDYQNKLLCTCPVCWNYVLKDKEDIVIDDEAQLAFPGDECPTCGSTIGFKVSGEVKKIDLGDLEKEEDKPAEEEPKDEPKPEENEGLNEEDEKFPNPEKHEKVDSHKGVDIYHCNDCGKYAALVNGKKVKKDSIDELKAEIDGVNESLLNEEPLPADLMGQIRKADSRYGRHNKADDMNRFNKGNVIMNKTVWDRDQQKWVNKGKYTGVQDYANATYKEVTPEDVLKMKKDGQDLSNVYIVKKGGGMIKLHNDGSPSDNYSSIKGLRANQSLKKSLEDADKIYITDIKDVMDTQPDKVRDRYGYEDKDGNWFSRDREANLALGKNRHDDYRTRRTSGYVRRNQEVAGKEAAAIKKQFDDGDISRKEMEKKLADIKKYSTPTEWEVRDYNQIRNRVANARNFASRQNLQKPIRDFKDAKDVIADAEYQIKRSEDSINDIESGDKSKYNEVSYAQNKVDFLKKQIASLQANLDYYQGQLDKGLKDDELNKYQQKIADDKQRIADAQATIDKLLKRTKKESLDENITVSTGDKTVEVNDENGDTTINVTDGNTQVNVSGAERVVPVSNELKQELTDISNRNIEVQAKENGEEDDDLVDVDVRDVDLDAFNDLGEQYLTGVYDNIKSFKATAINENNNVITVKGDVEFKSGNTKETTFKFTPLDVNKNGKVRFMGENLEISRGKKSFTLRGTVEDNKVIAESLSYNYTAKDAKGNSKQLRGTVRKKGGK